MRSKPFPPKFAYVAALAILLAVCFYAGSLATSDQPVSAQGANNPTDLTAPEGEFSCTIGNVAVYENRIHVYCPAHVGLIKYFAYSVLSSAQSRQANRYLAILNTAYALGKPVLVAFNDSSTANPPGCQTDDCRLITGLAIAP